MPDKQPITPKGSKGIFLTGATGFLGSNLALHLLLESSRVVFCLVRPHRDPQKRLTQAVLEAAEAAGLEEQVKPCLDRLQAIAGDLSKPALAVLPEDFQRLKTSQVDEIWHCAASLRFEAHCRAEIIEQNVSGTERVLALGQALGIADFNYISTAYVAGQKTGEIAEDRYDPSVEPNNCYEESKRLAEDLVLKAGNEDLFRIRIFRPSIVIGNSTTHDGISDNGPNGFILGLDRFKEEMDDKIPGYLASHPLRVCVDQNTGMNLVPVDIVVQDALTIARDRDENGIFFHLTNPFSVALEEAHNVIMDVFDVHIEMVDDEAKLRPADQMFRKKSLFFIPYFRNDKQFVRGRDGGRPAPELEISRNELRLYFTRYIARLQAEKEQSNRKAKRLLRTLTRKTIRCRHGEELTYYVHGEGPPLVLINAYGVSLEFWKKIIVGLESEYRLITWEARGCMTGPTAESFDVLEHVEDLREILDHEQVGPVHLAAWCTGPKVALEFQKRWPEQVQSMALITGSFAPTAGAEELTTRYDQVIGKVADLVCRRPEMAQVFLQTLTGMFGGSAAAQVDPSEDLVGDILGMISPRYQNLIVGPFMSEQAIANYARMVADFQKYDVSHLLDCVRVPTLVVGAENDVIAHPGVSELIAKQIPTARSICLTGASHWCLMENSAELLRELTSFFREAATARHDEPSRNAVEAATVPVIEGQPNSPIALA